MGGWLVLSANFGAPRWRLSVSVALWLLVAVTLSMTAGLTMRSLNRLAETRETVSTSLRIQKAQASLMSELLTAETGQRGYLLSGKSTYLQPYYTALAGIEQSRDALADALEGTPVATGALEALDTAVATKLKELEQTVRLRSDGHDAEALALVLTDNGATAMTAVRTALRTLAEDVDLRTTQELAGTNRELRLNYAGLAVSVTLNVVLLVGMALRLRFATTQNLASHKTLEMRNLDLANLLETASATNLQVRGLSELNRFLQACKDTSEAVRLLQCHLPALMGARSGAMYLMAASRDELSQAFAWGAEGYVRHFQPGDCWAVRLGQAFRQPADTDGVCCSHLDSLVGGLQHTQCLPLLAHGELSGVLVLDADVDADGTQAGVERNDGHRRIALEQVGLALGNLKLRESLRQQSIRDVLTGLFNRRFFEESMHREVMRAARTEDEGSTTGMALLLLDIDHFKRFNDDHGHDVGDQVLRGVAEVLLQQTRGSDVAARYGGEEFTVVLADISAELALARAEQIRTAVSQVALPGAGNAEGAVTVSIGMAQFPVNGRTMEELLAAADAALYEAKHAGRNQVIVAAQSGTDSAPTVASNVIAVMSS
jgi:diguanylate cyclase (GGDEF)-like protein